MVSRRDLCIGAAATLLLAPFSAEGKTRRGAKPATLTPVSYHKNLTSPKTPGLPRAGLVIDQDSGQVIESFNPDKLLPPASLTKLMTLYLSFAALEAGSKLAPDAPLERGTLRLDTALPVSAKAAIQDASKLYLLPGEKLAVRDGLRGMIGPSANDAAMVLAEGIAGSEAAFVALMNRTAKALGMRDTQYANPSGLPNSEQRTTVRDIAILMKHLRTDFPDYYPLFKDPVFFDRDGWRYNGKTHFSRAMTFGVNPDIRVKPPEPGSHLYPGMEAAKSGYIASAGCNMAANAERAGRHITAVVIGYPNGVSRYQEMVRLLDAGFAAPQPMPVQAATPARPPASAASTPALLADVTPNN